MSTCCRQTPLISPGNFKAMLTERIHHSQPDFDEERTQAAKEEILNNYSWANGLVVSGPKDY